VDEDDFPPDEVRSPSEVATRTLALFGVWGLSTNAPRTEVLEWIDTNGLRQELTPDELAFVSAPVPSKKQTINYSWQSERIVVLLWALKLVDNLPGPDEVCDTSIFQRCLPPFNRQSVEQFIAAAELQAEDDLWEMAERLLDLHWQARDSKLKGRPSKEPVDIEIIQERHHAINWITGYCGLPWDEVTTDT